MKGFPPLPAEYKHAQLQDIREAFLKSRKTLVIFDDDPTGTQTCYDVTVLTSWQVPLLTAELKKNPDILFILTNSRSLTGEKASQLCTEIGRNLMIAVEASGRQILPISRSDSTLRGHFPDEVKAIAQSLHFENAVWVLIPAFVEGGRFTFGDTHYLKEQGELVPIAETQFAKDGVFGYRHSDLKEWVEEKTKGEVKASDVMAISLEDIRLGGPAAVGKKLESCQPGDVCIVNAISYRDLEVVVAGLQQTETRGKKLLCRTSATFVPIRAGFPSGKIYRPAKRETKTGSLVVVGSYVPKTTGQLEYLLQQNKHKALEVQVKRILESDVNDLEGYLKNLIAQTENSLLKGKDVVIYTSRQLEAGRNSAESLHINQRIADFLVDLVHRLNVRPACVISKGGITSSDMASKALASETALILGQVIAGVPVWRLDEKSKFPGLELVVFPGNVGESGALFDVYEKMK